ncbi:hypothetical protein J0H58_18810 [bacterium]|nr:hypothetical protein [bacterium]
MRNRTEGGSSGWWDDLPPGVKARFAGPPPAAVTPAADAADAPPRSGPTALDWIRELSRFALLFLAVAVANVLFLLVALSFIGGHGRPLAPPPAIPAR